MKTLHYIYHLNTKNINRYKLLQNFPNDIKTSLINNNSYPIIEKFDGYEMFVILLPLYNSHQQQITLIECDIIIWPDDVFIITNEEYDSINTIVKSTKHNTKHIPTTYRILIALCQHILSHITTLEKVIEKIKLHTIDNEGYTETTINDVMKLKLTIWMFKSTIEPLSDIMNHLFETIDYNLYKEQEESHKNQIDYLIKQIKAQSNFLYENISIVADTSNAIQNIHANTIMKTLTIISSIFIPLSFITWIFGMNFTDLPINNTIFYYSIIIAMIFIWSLQLYVFKKRKRF